MIKLIALVKRHDPRSARLIHELDQRQTLAEVRYVDDDVTDFHFMMEGTPNKQIPQVIIHASTSAELNMVMCVVEDAMKKSKRSK